MNSFQKIIYLAFFLFITNLFIVNNLLFTTTFFSIINFFLLYKNFRSQNYINKLTLIEIFCWSINTYLVIQADFTMWFLALNNLLWILTSIKMIEVKNFLNGKNAVIFMFLSVGTSSLFSLNLYSKLIHIICIFLLLLSLLILNNYKGRFFYKQIITLILFIPLSFLSYFFMPKVKPWLNINSRTLSETGITNTLRPGDISSLAKNEDLVGRVFFSSQNPSQDKRYWRVFVLDKFTNNIWRESKKIKKENLELSQNLNLKISETLKFEEWIVEPNYKQNIPWSGEGIPLNKEIIITKKGALSIENSLNQRMKYQILDRGNSWRKIKPKLDETDIELNDNNLLKKLGQKWFKESDNKKEIINKAEIFFKESNFQYTLNPGRMNKKNPYDDFLFKKKKGFCEHYAGSLALLMRAANIPSRVVIGYQGGEVLRSIQNENYLLIDNSYSHAWTEVWLDNQGWIRIDPTEWVAPGRIQNSELMIDENKSRYARFNNNFGLNLYRNFSNIEFSINRIIDKLNFKPKSNIFSRNKIINRLITIFLLSICLIVSITTILLFNNFKRFDPLRTIINLYLNILRIYDLNLSEGETFKHFSYRICEKYPSISSQILRIADSYNLYRFKVKTSNSHIIKTYLNLLVLEYEVIIHIIFNQKSKGKIRNT